MAPLCRAIKALYSHNTEDSTVYCANVDPEWSVGSIPNGGYVLALILQACMDYQSATEHRDVIHITAHFLSTTSLHPCEIYIRKLKTGRTFSNVIADLLQKGQTKTTTHIIFGVLASQPDDSGPRLTLQPPSRYARRLPLFNHPSTATVIPMRSTWTFHPHVRWTKEPDILARNNVDSPSRTDSTTVGGGGVEWGTWFELVDSEEKVTTPSLAFLVDTFINLPVLLPQSERKGLTTSWFPTMTLSIEFKFPIPFSTQHAQRTVGVYSCGRFLNDPQGRHDAYVEVWTAPSNIGEGQDVPGWRDQQRCLAIATQMALTVPIEVNRTKAEKDAKL